MPARGRPTLLEQVQGLIQRTYDHPAFLGSLTPFLVGDEGFRRWFSGRDLVRRVGSGEPAGAQVLLTQGDDGSLRASLYLPDRLVRHLERHPPSALLSSTNVDAFATFVEEIDHLLLLAARARSGPALTLLELELHANVTKELVLRHYASRLEGGRKLTRERLFWIRHHLFGKRRFKDPDRSVRTRYRHAARLALRYLERLDRTERSRRLRELRRFSRMSHHQKLRLLGSPA